MPEIARRLNLGVSTIYRLVAEQKEREDASSHWSPSNSPPGGKNLSDRPRGLFHSAVRKTSNKRPTYRGQTRCRMGQPCASSGLMHRGKKASVAIAGIRALCDLRL